MTDSTRHRTQQYRNYRQTAITLLAVLVFVIAGVFSFFRFYNTYNDETLYAERLNQMREVTTQLFSGLEDVVKNQWRNVSALCRSLRKLAPATVDQLLADMGNQAALSDFETTRCNVVAVDSSGWYYTQSGRQGLLAEREYLVSQPERISFVSNTMTNDETRMVFLRRLDRPVTLRDGDQTVTLSYYGISQNMEELNPYFACKAYDGQNSVYVVDDSGLKLFSSSSGDLLKGYNVFTILRNMEYLHGSSFDDTLEAFSDNHIAYSNAKLENTELYYSLYKMDSSAWTLIFLVPSQYVAMNTVNLVNTTTRLILIFAVSMILVCAAAILWLSRRQQAAAVAAERRNSAQLEKLNQELAAASQAKSEFLANMSHDIRTPMNAIVGIVTLLEHDGGLTDKQQTYIQKIQMSSKHLLSLINDVLDMSKIESSEVVLNQEPISLSEQVSQIENIIRPQAEEWGQTFTIRVHGLRHENLIGDGVRLQQIFINLLSNAVKYTPNGGKIALELTELPCQDEGNATIRITVSDNGYGMTPEFLQHIFEPFTRSESSVTNKIQGTGLGMAITKSIVDMAGGTIQVHSEPDKGSRFDVTLTLPIDTARPKAQQNRPAEEGHTALAGMRFLCAEDNDLNAEILSALLEMNGASCVIYPDGARLVEAFQRVKPGDYDAILMDVQMPVMNGLEASKAIRGGKNPLGRTIPIIAMTANAFAEDVRACLEAGMNAHVSKPLDITALERAVSGGVAPPPCV